MNLIKRFWYEEDGIGIVEIILILVILIGLVAIFRTQITDILQRAFNSITRNSNEVISDIEIDFE
ncbi:putative flagellin with Flp1-like domain [Natranaerovirga pectinivora]|uniref:Putative flagellin with Flp1-like domain n=1 Tax=Natranaerovirga pectinivora TaxID=682400 RepID=A0A4R3MDD9_9FIRM|nr:Flp1 family type IVb pilin [Natranaerovirga pectinivora]TCT11650.1 putative flagellin with Flp1-like domain [Natranaerovirga pectinivora]